MKTPKRNKGNGYEADCFPFEGPNQTAFEHARWKRKNKIAQLKRTIARLEAENFELEYLSTRITYEGTMQEMLTFQPTP